MQKLCLSAISLSLALLAFPNPAASQTATLARDINTEKQSAGVLEDILVVGGKVFFVSHDLSTGTEPWVSDGTASGMTLLADICQGGCGSAPRMIGGVNGAALWTAESEDQHRRLWRSDGTREGTYPLDDPENGFYLGEDGVFFGGFYYTISCSQETGCEPWRTNGTAAGTELFKEIVPGPAGGFAGEMTVAGSRIFFVSWSASGTVALWVSDGTAGGTRPLKELVNQFYPRFLTAAGDRVFFLSGDGQGGDELWTSDGTVAGTRAVTEFAVSEPFGDRHSLEGSFWFKPAGRRVYFIADDGTHGAEIWRSDGTPEGTRRITEFGYNQAVSTRSGPLILQEVAGGRIVFRAYDGLTSTQLWTTDGTPESTAPLRCGGTCSSLFQVVSNALTPAGGRAVFLADDGAHGVEPWVTDGTARGTRMLQDTCPGTCSTIRPPQPVPWGVLFVAGDPAQGYEIWESDGTPAGTRRFTNLPAGTQPGEIAVDGTRVYFAALSPDSVGLWTANGPSSTRRIAVRAPEGVSSHPYDLVPYQGQLFFSACETTLREVWWSAGTPEATLPLTSGGTDDCALYGGEPLRLTPAGGQLFFQRSDPSTYRPRLWRTDGTPQGTIQLTFAGDVLKSLFEFRGQLYFLVHFYDAGHAVWKSDGTPQGTAEVFRLPHPAEMDGRVSITSSHFWFTLTVPPFQTFEIWRSDGTPGGTRKVTEIRGGAGEFVQLGSKILFRGIDPATGSELWATDGTAAGTALVADATPGSLGTEPVSLTVFQGALYYFGRAPDGRWRSLWRSDGTAAGTVPLKDFRTAAGGLVPSAGRLFFAADDGVHGSELWSTDGTAAGTSMVRDLFPGPRSSFPSALTAAGGRLWFVADDGTHGTELWQSDGTAAGTRLAQDVAPQAISSNPRQLTVAGGRLFFTADDGSTGREVWSLPLAAPSVCQPSSTVLCIGNGRYQVEASWRDFAGGTGRGQAVPLTPDTGYFWFFDDANVETVVKVLDGTGSNGHVWVFYGALSNVEYTITVTDTQTGLTRRYYNPLGQFASIGDTRGFGPLGAHSSSPAPSTAAPSPPPLIAERTDPAAATGTCQSGAERLCLHDSRFAVEVSWRDFQNRTGKGKAVSLTADTGYFWFFDGANVELVAKIVDGRASNGKYWFFYGALSNVEYTVTVTDTQTGNIKTYRNPRGRFASVGDTRAF